MLVTDSRPRNLKWFHAGPLLYGDWGTSRLYVLGLAFFFTGFESVFYLLAIGVLMVVVAWAYSIVCRLFPDGGGVYTAGRQIHPTISVVGATLLLCGYLITAAISIVEALHYFGVPEGPLLVAMGVGILLVIGAINWFGARSAGNFALVIAIAAMGVSLVLGLMCLRYVPAGLSNITLLPEGGLWPRWNAFTGIVLALAGIEAVANMTGLMKEPVGRTARRTIWPVLAEVVVLNLLFGVAMTGLFASIPELSGIRGGYATVDVQQLDPAVREQAVERIEEIKNTAMEVVAVEAGRDALGERAGTIFGKSAAIVFGLLLLSATNTAVMAMVSVMFSMASDRELPRGLTRLNYSGVPWLALVISVAFSIAIIFIERRPEKLAELYIIGVVGAITVSVISVAANGRLDLGRGQRGGMWALSAFLSLIALTILLTRLNATVFAGGIIALVLGSRWAMLRQRRRHPEPIPEPETGWLGLVNRMPADLDPSRPRIMLAARGRYQSEFAVDTAKRRDAVLFGIYVRTLRVMDVGPHRIPRIEEDRQAQQALGATAVLAEQAGVPFVPIYVISDDIAEEILDYTVTFGCDTLIMGKSRRSRFARKLEGDVVELVRRQLPEEVALIARSAEVPHRTSSAA